MLRHRHIVLTIEIDEDHIHINLNNSPCVDVYDSFRSNIFDPRNTKKMTSIIIYILKVYYGLTRN